MTLLEWQRRKTELEVTMIYMRTRDLINQAYERLVQVLKKEAV